METIRDFMEKNDEDGVRRFLEVNSKLLLEETKRRPQLFYGDEGGDNGGQSSFEILQNLGLLEDSAARHFVPLEMELGLNKGETVFPAR